MQVLPGSQALSPFQLARLLAKIQVIEPTISSIDSRFIHLIDTDSELTGKQQLLLESLLKYGEPSNLDIASNDLIVIIPRAGTISSWSSKATDIVQNAGLNTIRRVERAVVYAIQSSGKQFDQNNILHLLYDRMTEQTITSLNDAGTVFVKHQPRPLKTIDILSGGEAELVKANQLFGFALSNDEIAYLVKSFKELGRNPTDTELMMFAQANSEHCRHKIFNADWIIDGQKQDKSLFAMIRNTYNNYSDDVLSAYSDNAAVLRGKSADRFFPNGKGIYDYTNEPIHSVIKVETHNHPTAISPYPGAATGTGGELRDEGATGRGAKPKMGLAGYSVSDLRIPELAQKWETSELKPSHTASPLDIMLEAPIGAASYSNEFGRPNLAGYFRSYEQAINGQTRGYHKPIMIAGGLGNIRDMHVQKNTLQAGTKIILLGGPAMLIGLGGGAASSVSSSDDNQDLDFASVQRANAEMERRCQEVIDRCWQLGDDNPIITIHDIGAGGYSVALSEFVHDSNMGGTYELRDIPSADHSMSPMEIWCNEAQERYVLGINESDLARFKSFCERERCPLAVVGEATNEQQLVLSDRLFNNKPINLPMEILFGKPPKMTRTVKTTKPILSKFDTSKITINEAVNRVLQLPAVGSKKFLITIGDRNVGGLTIRDQMIGPWQVPVSDVAVTASSFTSNTGEAMSLGERAPLASIDAAAAARITIGETITNLLAADIDKLSDVKLSANWQAASSDELENQRLYEAVSAIGMEFCPALNIAIPVGKDSLSMSTNWGDTNNKQSVISPLSLITTGFAPVNNVTQTLTPQLNLDVPSCLILVDLGKGSNRLGGSALTQTYSQLGNDCPDIDPSTLQTFFDEITTLKKQNLIMAYHDRSDGGLLTCVAEMAFASRCGLQLDISSLPGSPLSILFNEELGAVIQVSLANKDKVLGQLSHASYIGSPSKDETIVIEHSNKPIINSTRANLETAWASTSYHIQKLRDNPDCAEAEFNEINQPTSGLSNLNISFNFASKLPIPEYRPRVAIFREEGVNGQVEMAAAFDTAGFTAVDVHLNDLRSGRMSLSDFTGLAACGGFSYGDVLGAGAGWAKLILADTKLCQQFTNFFERPDTFTLGVCNGCQMLSQLKSIIPGASCWPSFKQNESMQFEARLVNVTITDSPSILLKDMVGSTVPIPVAHGEGRAVFDSPQDQSACFTCMEYSNDTYPHNPNGSPSGATAFTTTDGRATIMMPHPERAFQARQLSWHPSDWDNNSPWLRMFQNARSWVDGKNT